MQIEGEEAAYLMGTAAPVTSSILTSSSRYLSNPRFRDVYAQMGLKRDGHDLPPAYLIPEINRAMVEETDEAQLFELIDLERRRLPEFAQWLDARHTSNWNDQELSSHAAGTVGAMIRNFVESSGFNIDFMFRADPANDFEYINKRRVQNHDIEHMITGLDTSQVGELALIVANTVAIHRYFTPELAGILTFQPMFLASTGLMRMACHYPAVVPAVLEGFARGQALGDKQTKPLFMIAWEDWLNVPIDEARRHFSFENGPEPGHWAWTDTASRG